MPIEIKSLQGFVDLPFLEGIFIFVCNQNLRDMKRTVSPILSSVLTLSLFALIIAGCGTKEPQPTTVAVTGVSLDKTSLSLVEGSSETLTATVSPENASNKSVSWKSSAADVATVDGSGKVTAVKAGSATVTVTTADGSKTASCSVTVTEEAKIVITGNTAKAPAQGGTAEFPIKYNTSYTIEIEQSAREWLHFVETKAMQSGTLVFSVDANTGDTRTGKATLKADDGKIEPITLTFEQDPFIAVSSVQVSPEAAELEVGETFALTVTVLPANATGKTVTWASDNESVATVSESGVVTGKADGSATITATAGEKTASCIITVKPSAYEVERSALEALYRANNGDKWTYRTNWCTDKPLSEWWGIQMTPDNKHVRSIRLYYNEVDGYIPEQIGDLSELEELAIGNYLYLAKKSSPLPDAIGRLKKLKILDFQNYSLSGTLPSSLFSLKNLEKLRICYAQDMTPMPIPKEIGQLTELTELCLSGMNLTGELIPEIGRLTKLQRLVMFSNQLTGGIPETFGNLVNLEWLDLSTNDLSGEIPSSFYLLENFWKLWPDLIWGNSFTQDQIRNAMIPAPKSPPIPMLSGKTLDLAEEFARNQYTVLFSTGPAAEGWDIIPALVELYNAHKDEGLGIITYFDNNTSAAADVAKRDSDFKDFLSDYNVPWDSFIRHMYDDNPAAPFYTERGHGLYPYGSMDEIVVIGPEGTVQYATLLDSQCLAREKLEHFMDYIREIMGSPVVHYESTDYSADGTVTVLQKATVGHGIDLVITGDAFSDRLIKDGTMERLARQAAEDFFSQEPYTSLRNRFNIYLVNAVSKYEEYFHGGSTVFSGAFWGPTFVCGDDEKVLSYAAKALDASRMDNVVILVLMNSGLGGGTAFLYDSVEPHYAGGPSVTYVPYRDPKVIGGISRKAEVLIHEAGGHGFGRLADEYEIRSYGNISDNTIAYLKECHKKNWFLNVDVTSDPQKILWSRYIGDSRFADEEIGVYQGGYSYFYGVWRPTRMSVMNSNYGNQNNYFNAPSRAQIYTRIMKLSEGQDWQFDYEAFAKWDKAHPTKMSAAPATRSDYVEIDDVENEDHVPPVILGKTWREVIQR